MNTCNPAAQAADTAFLTVADLDGSDDAAEWISVGHVLDAGEVAYIRSLVLPDSIETAQQVARATSAAEAPCEGSHPPRVLPLERYPAELSERERDRVDAILRHQSHHIPTEPGLYRDHADDWWLLDESGGWVDNRGERRDGQDAQLIAAFGPLRKVEPTNGSALLLILESALLIATSWLIRPLEKIWPRTARWLDRWTGSVSQRVDMTLAASRIDSASGSFDG